MSAIPSRHIPVMPTEPVFPLSVEQYHAMINAGVITDDDPVELLEGVLVFKMPKNPPHRYVVQTAQAIIQKLLPQGWSYQAQEPITLSDGEPEPDGVVFRGAQADFQTRHPGSSDVALVIEVADTTLARDRGMKLRSYARAGVPVYWIVNLNDRTLEVYSTPDARKDDGSYLSTEILTENGSVDVRISDAILGRLAIRDLLPSASEKQR